MPYVIFIEFASNFLLLSPIMLSFCELSQSETPSRSFEEGEIYKSGDEEL